MRRGASRRVVQVHLDNSTDSAGASMTRTCYFRAAISWLRLLMPSR
jgi:hypothetical protein